MKLTKEEALNQYKEGFSDYIEEMKEKKDYEALKLSWNIYTDGLCRDGYLSLHQVNTWSNPFEKKKK